MATSSSTTPAAPAILQVRGLHKSFGPRAVLRGVDLDVERGTVLVILGPNGSGKSTLLRCINLLETYEQGEVIFDGRVTSRGRPPGNRPSHAERDSARLLREHVGMVFQRLHLFPHMTVLQNVMCAPRKVLGVGAAKARQTAEEMLRKVGLWEKHPCDPATLSGGQQQRAAIARALAMNPDVMLFDECTSSLDPLMTKEVFNVVRELAAEGMTMVLVTHDLDLAEDIADRIVFMEDGRITAQGTADEMLKGKPVPGLRRFIEEGY